MNSFAPGQRWFSSAEPELGLGTVLRLAGRQVDGPRLDDQGQPFLIQPLVRIV